jgi:transcriptional regulator with XRE-family HTH domain
MSRGIDVAQFGEQLRRVRLKRKKTLEEVSEQTGVPIPTLSRIERGAAKDVKSKTLLALSGWMGTSIEKLQEKPVPVLHGGRPVAETPDIVELHLRADKRLDPRTAMVLAKMFRATYDEMSKLSGSGENR